MDKCCTAVYEINRKVHNRCHVSAIACTSDGRCRKISAQSHRNPSGTNGEKEVQSMKPVSKYHGKAYTKHLRQQNISLKAGVCRGRYRLGPHIIRRVLNWKWQAENQSPKHLRKAWKVQAKLRLRGRGIDRILRHFDLLGLRSLCWG